MEDYATQAMEVSDTKVVKEKKDSEHKKDKKKKKKKLKNKFKKLMKTATRIVSGFAANPKLLWDESEEDRDALVCSAIEMACKVLRETGHAKQVKYYYKWVDMGKPTE